MPKEGGNATVPGRGRESGMDSGAEFQSACSLHSERAPILNRDYRKPSLAADVAVASDFIENPGGGDAPSIRT